MPQTHFFVAEGWKLSPLWEYSHMRPLHIFAWITKVFLQLAPTMTSHVLFTCKYCNHKPFKSALGLASHVAQVKRCSLLSQKDGRVPLAPPPPLRQPLGDVDNQQPVERHRKRKSTERVGPETRADAHAPVINYNNPHSNIPGDRGQMDKDSNEWVWFNVPTIWSHSTCSLLSLYWELLAENWPVLLP